VPQDYVAAASWYRKSAEQGNAMAQYNLGVIYDDGQGVPQDYAVAMSWYRKAADQGYIEAQISLGIFYSMGQGVSRDYVIAHMWLSLAAGGDKKGAEARNKMTPAQARDIVANHMTPTQIAEAQKLAREWKPTSIPTPAGSAPMSKLLGQHALPPARNDMIAR
jgi:TPR repeat protein